MTGNGSYACGIDAGASKTACAICTAEGTVLMSYLGLPAPILGDDARFLDRIAAVVDATCAGAGIARNDLQSVVAGVAGVDTPRLEERARAALRVTLPAADVAVHNDATIALAAATSVRPAGVLMGGTGSIAYGEDASGERHRVGGWGYIFGDEGSGYDIAVSAVAKVLRAVDGRDGETSLRERMLEHFSLADPREVMELHDVAARDPSTAAAFAPLVFAAEREGDAVAAEIIGRAADELAAIGVRLLELIEPSGSATLALGGSLLEQGAHYAALVEARIVASMPSARIVRPALPPVAGGLLKAVEALGGQPDNESLRRRLAEGLNHRRPM